MNPTIQSVLVLGAGAVGGFYGARLAQIGLQVSFVCRSNFEAIATKGLQIRSYQGDFSITPEQVVQDTKDYQGKPDLLVIATKVVPGNDLTDQIAPLVHPGLTILLIQNGIEVEAPIAEAFPAVPLLSAIAFVGVTRTAPGQIHHQLRGDLEIGSFGPGQFDSALKRVLTAFESTGLKIRGSQDIVKSRWVKLLWNAAFNPLSVLGQADTQRILELPGSEAQIRAIMGEVMALAEAAGKPLDPQLAEKNIAATYKMPPYKTSMLVDFEAHRPLETEAILGKPIKIAHRLGIAVPRLELLEALLHLLADQKRG
ncbi:MAG: 2-dehydropantoate 2-reductase [bacterium]|nr:2-dehydropantoate 2-reductase [bacterium]